MQSALRIPRVELKRKQRDIKNNPQPFAGRKCPRHRRLCARPPGPIRSGHRIEGGPGSAGCAVGPRLRRCLQVPVLGSFRRSRPRRGTALPVGFPTRNKQTKSPNPNHATCVLWSDTLNLGSNTVKKRGGGGGGGDKNKKQHPTVFRILSSFRCQVSVCAQVSAGQPQKDGFYYRHSHNYSFQVLRSHIRNIFFKLKRLLLFLFSLPSFPVIKTFQKVFSESL